MDVINLVSSDEEDNDGSLKGKIKSNKNIIIKKVKTPKVSQNVKDIPTQKIVPPIVHQKNNNTKQVTVITAFKNQQSQSLLQKAHQTQTLLKPKQQPTVLPKNQQPSQLLSQKRPPQWMVNSIVSKDGKLVESKKPTLNLSSGLTITPVSKNAVNSNNHSVVSNVGTVTIKPRTDKVTVVPKPPVTVVVDNQPTKPINAAISRPAKRIVPTKISDTVTMRASSMEKSSDSDMLSRDSSSIANDDVVPNNIANGTNQPEQENNEPKAKRPKVMENVKNPMHEHYIELIEVCKNVDPTEDMKKIVAKLEKYYHRAHTAFVNSKSFHKFVQTVTAEIRAQPKLVYMKINSVLEELRTRKTEEVVTVASEDNSEMSEVDEKKAKNIQKLSAALRILQKKIRKCEEAEVDWNDELNSKYLVTERLKKRAWDIYEKLCDLTGESRSAERIVKKPIKFNGTKYPEFNRKLEKFINETKSFPDMFDVLRIMDYCSKQYNYKMSKENRKTVAQEAFHEVGTVLQKRRKADLYEMVQYFAANHDDPAGEDPSLKSKLEENQRHYNKRMKEVIEKFTMHHTDSEANDESDSPVKVEPKSSVSRVKVPPVLIDPTIEPPALNLNAEIDMLNDSVTFISDSDYNDISKGDSILIDEQDVAHELEQEFLPTITSVTSLHPSEFNDLMNFEMPSSNPLDCTEIS